MLAIQIKDVKTFMSKLLSGNIFDSFLLEEANLHTFNTFTIDGHQNREFYTREELEDPELFPYKFSEWKNMKTICFQLIKGKKVPTFMKIILQQKPENTFALLKENDALEYSDTLKSFMITIKFDSNGLLLTTGTSFSTFIMDKTPDLLWDNAFRTFLTAHEIEFEEV